MPIFNNIHFKEIICKNDDCRKLLGYEKVKSGMLFFICPRCKQNSVFRINYGKGRENFDTLVDSLENGEVK